LSKESWLAEVSWNGDNVFVGSDDAGHSVVYDSADGVQKGIGPVRALLTAMGACSGIDVVSILKKRHQKVDSLKILLNGDRPEHGYPKPWTSIHAKYLVGGKDLDPKYVEEAVRDSIEKYCSVAACLRPTAKITYSYEIVS
jgi:putative redox protein